MTPTVKDIESHTNVSSEPKRAKPQTLSARSDESVTNYDIMTPIEVRMVDGRIFHTSLAKLNELLETLRAERTGRA